MQSPTKAAQSTALSPAWHQPGSTVSLVATCAVLLVACFVVLNGTDRFGGLRAVAAVLQQQHPGATTQLSTPATSAFDGPHADYMARHEAATALLDNAFLSAEQRTELSRLRFVVVTVCKLGYLSFPLPRS